MTKESTDRLAVNIGNKILELDILANSLNKSYSAFNYATGVKRTIEGYNLTPDVENLGKEALRDLEEVTNSADKMFEVILVINGNVKKGNATIAEKLSLCGITLDVELHN